MNEGLRLLLVGASYRTCSIGAREGLLRRVTDSRLWAACRGHPPWDDLVLLSTCNRVEVYVLTPAPERAARVVQDCFGLPVDSRPYVLEDFDAAAHLVRVAAGLDSLALGEGQVAGQVRRAPSAGPAGRARGKTLSALFTRAAHVAPRIRSLTGLSEDPTSASHAAVRYISEVVPLPRPVVALIGSGKMARLASSALHGRAELLIVDRNENRARKVVSGTCGAVARFEDLPRILLEVDVAIAATASETPCVTARNLRDVLARRRRRPLWMIDLGFPRNIDPRSRGIEGITLVDIDGLHPWATRTPSPEAVARAEARIRQEARSFLERLRPAEADAIRSFRRGVEDLRRREVDEAFARLPGASDADRAVLETLTNRLVNRLLHGPTHRLREIQARGHEDTVRRLVREWQDRGVEGDPR